MIRIKTIYFAIGGHPVYNRGMKSVVALAVAILLFVWGLGLFLGYLSGLKKFKMPENQSNTYGPAYLEDQRRLSEESEESRRKMMQDYRFQTQKYKDTFPRSPSFGKF